VTTPPGDSSIENEPHLRPGKFKPDPSEARADETFAFQGPPTDEDRLEQSVWEEPTVTPEAAARRQAHDLTYGEWLDAGRRRTSVAASWRATLGVALLSGPLSILGSLFGSLDGPGGYLSVVVFGPLVEELMKAAPAAYLVEKRPYLFRSPAQILLSMLAAGAAFGIIENLIYLKLYIPGASAGLAAWRWTVCTALHAGCSTVAGLGLLRVWKDAEARRARPRLGLAMSAILVAAVLHGAYNLFAVILEATSFTF
jgi:hypothetical protein